VSSTTTITLTDLAGSTPDGLDRDDAEEEDGRMGLPIPDETVVLIVVIFLLAAVLRWVFGAQTSRIDRKLAKARDYGLLREIATVPSQQAARFVQDRLRERGIRSTLVPCDQDGRLRVLVFPADAPAAAATLLRDPE
jgi:hypothetical protein